MNVNDANEASTGIDITSNIIPENSPKNTVVGVVIPHDPDAGEVFHYALIRNDDSVGLDDGTFAITSDTGVLTGSDPSKLDYETLHDKTITTRVRVTDSAQHSIDRTLVINVTDVNEPPTDATLSNNIIPENLAAGGLVGVVTGIDPDRRLDDPLHYAIIRSDGSVGLSDDTFAINPDTGVITVKDPSALNFETLPPGNILSTQVRITDSAQHSIDRTFFINVTDVSEAPTISEIDLESENVFSLADSGTIIGSIVATDPDRGDHLTYSIEGFDVGEGFPPDPVSIDQNGVITLTGRPFSDTSDRTVTVRVTDSGGLFADDNFQIHFKL